MSPVYRKINSAPRLYGLRWYLVLVLVGVLFGVMFVAIRLAGAAGIALSFLLTGVVYVALLALEGVDPFLIRGALNIWIERELTSMQGSRQRVSVAGEVGPC